MMGSLDATVNFCPWVCTFGCRRGHGKGHLIFLNCMKTAHLPSLHFTASLKKTCFAPQWRENLTRHRAHGRWGSFLWDWHIPSSFHMWWRTQEHLALYCQLLCVQSGFTGVHCKSLGDVTGSKMLTAGLWFKFKISLSSAPLCPPKGMR